LREEKRGEEGGERFGEKRKIKTTTPQHDRLDEDDERRAEEEERV
jgi:hypothetical protein